MQATGPNSERAAVKNEMKNLVPRELIALVNFCQAAMLILNARLFTLLGLLLCAGAFGYALWVPDYTRTITAVAFAVIVYLPLLRMEARREIVTKQGDENG